MAMMRTVFLAGLATIPLAGSAQMLSTGTLSNNGTGGIFMDLTPTTQNLNVVGFDTQLAGTILASIQVWTRTGSYVGFTTSNVGWTLHDTITATGAGTTVNVAANLNNVIGLTAGQTTAVYLHSTTSGAGIRYFGTGTTSTSNYSNADLAMFTNISRTGAIAFGGSQFTPRAFVGNVRYQVVPEPATMAVLGLGAAALLRRRRKA